MTSESTQNMCGRYYECIFSSLGGNEFLNQMEMEETLMENIDYLVCIKIYTFFAIENIIKHAYIQ